jgi:hypothetical protein
MEGHEERTGDPSRDRSAGIVRAVVVSLRGLLAELRG